MGLDDLSMTIMRERLGKTLPASLLVPEGKPAAVATIYREGERGPEILLIQRAERQGDPWGGHMAFPGGRHETKDASLFHTAVRETNEEIGIDLERCGELVGVLGDHEATARRVATGMPVRPYVFELIGSPVFSTNEEVQSVVWLPIVPSLRGENKTTISVTYEGVSYTLPGYEVTGRTVWGLTYKMLQDLFTRLRA